jgi:hypothetical protein
MMIDPDLIPRDICSRDGVRELNDVLARLIARKIDRLALMEPESLFRLSNYIRAYCQAHIRRCLSLAESAYVLFFDENGLVSLLCARAIYETVASFCHFEGQLQAIIKKGDLADIFEFTKAKAHATRIPFLLEKHGSAVQATNILTQIDKLNALRPKAREEYDFLSDVTHPNSMGGYHFFASNPDKDDDVVTFSDGGPDPRADLQWILAACSLLTHFEAALNRIDAELPALSEKGRANAPTPANPSPPADA